MDVLMTQRRKARTGSQRSTKTKSARKGLTARGVVRRNSALTEAEKNRLVFEATERFLKSVGEIKDIYGKLDR